MSEAHDPKPFEAEADGTIQLPARLDLRATPDLIATLHAQGTMVRLCADEVEVLTSPALQALLSAAQSKETHITVEAPSAAFLDCLALLGCDLDMITTSAGVAA